MHPGRGPGLTDRRLGQRGGVTQVTLTEAQMPLHNHTVFLNQNAVGDSNSPQNRIFAQSAVPDASVYSADTPGVDAGILTESGGSQPHNNMQPYIGVNFIIALVGLYPSRS
jgi:microcystin-dependent protein